MKKLYIILIAFAGFSKAQNLNTQLRACYPFEGNTQNYAASGSLLNGSSSTNVSYGAGHFGTSSNAIHFAGDTSSYVKLPSNSLIKPKQISISGWFYADTIQDSYVIYTANSCSSNDEAYSLVYKVNQFMTEIASGINGCNRAQVFSATVTPKTWYHVVVYADTTVLKLYVNGVMNFQSHNLSWDYVPGANVVLANSLSPYLQSSFKGKIDNLRFYDRQLTQAEVNLLYASDPSCVEGTIDIYSYGNNEGDVLIFPNPTSKNCTIKSQLEDEAFTIRLFDGAGRMVFEARNKNEVDISHIHPGLFLVEIINDKNNVTRKKLVVE